MTTPIIVRVLTTCLCLLVAAEASAVALDLAFPPPLAKILHASPVVLDHKGAWLGALPVEDGRWRLRADLKRIDPTFVRRVKALEDARFDRHPGVDPLAIVRAALSDLTAGRVRSGGSTLTMQLARRLQPRPRTLSAKLIEAARALQLEYRLGKRGVLAAYLTVTPYGGNLEGVRAASLAYFGHEPDSLSDAEQALLIALPQAPEARRPDRHPAAARAARSHILARLQMARLISPAARSLAETDPLPRRQPLPTLAWQAVRELARRAPASDPNVVTTLDARLQAQVETMAAETAVAQGGSTSVAVLVVDVRTRAVLASVGSAGRDRPGGWVDVTRALRSPGSALKPFIYAMAFEDGLAAPDTKMRDAAAVYADYRPQDFDRAFHGEVTARQALQSSLNVPAVNMLASVGPSAFEQRLRAAGVTFVRPRAGLVPASLALALGGEGTTLRDVAMLYAALGDGGIAKPLAWTLADARAWPRQPGVRLVGEQAAGQVLDILRQGAPPEDHALAQLRPDAQKIAFKTGTSYGYRDALAAGVGGGRVVAVWTGRPDGGGRPGLTGREAALPLLFDLFDRLEGANVAPALDQGAADGAPAALQQMAGEFDPPPRLLFPLDGAVLQIDAVGPAGPGFALSAQGRGLRWYVGGAPIRTSALTGQTIWRPRATGFYRLEAVDDTGRRAAAKVRVSP
jgi:penicillin-binding protein 1C